MEFAHRSTALRPVLPILLVLVLAACGGQPAAPSSPAATAVPAQPTAAAAPVATEPAAPTAVPTAVPAPASAPTAVPTAAPLPTAVPTEAPQPTEAPAAAEAAPTGSAGLDLLMNALRAQFAQKAWRTTVTIEDGGEVNTTMIEYVAPDSVHMTMGPGVEFIILKEGTWQKGEDGKWQKLPMDMSSMVASILDPAQVDDLMKDTTVDQVKFLGPDLIGGKPVWVYHYASRMNLGEETIASDAKLWIGVLDRLPYRGEGEGDSIKNPGSKLKTSVVYEYGPDIKIEAPVQ